MMTIERKKTKPIVPDGDNSFNALTRIVSDIIHENKTLRMKVAQFEQRSAPTRHRQPNQQSATIMVELSLRAKPVSQSRRQRAPNKRNDIAARVEVTGVGRYELSSDGSKVTLIENGRTSATYDSIDDLDLVFAELLNRARNTVDRTITIDHIDYMILTVLEERGPLTNLEIGEAIESRWGEALARNTPRNRLKDSRTAMMKVHRGLIVEVNKGGVTAWDFVG